VLAESITRESQLYELFLTHMLEAVAGIGDEHEKNPEKKQVDAVVGHRSLHGDDVAQLHEQLAIREVEQYIRPLAITLSHNVSDTNFALRFGLTPLLRDFWLNCVLNGIYYGSEIAIKHADGLKIIAKYTPPLIDGVVEDRSFDANLDERSLLKRGMTQQGIVDHKRRLMNMLPDDEIHIRTLTYHRTIFLEAAYTLECMRAEAGGCSKVLAYFVEPAFKAGEASNVMAGIASRVTDIYISRILMGSYPDFSASSLADQLADVFVGCCHRLEKVQMTAVIMADRIITTAPSALCRRSSLFALLELLTLMWASCLTGETDEYATRSIFTSKRGRVAIEMPDSYQFRKRTLKNFHAKAKTWVMKILNIAPFDLKGLLQTYLSEFEDEGSLGHVSLGRTFALEMGGTLPSTDRRLGM
jgi:phosphatidylinositol 4-kinase